MAPPRTKPRIDLQTWNLNDAEKMLIEDALKASGNDLNETGKKLGISRDAVKRRLKHHGIVLPEKGAAA